MASYHRPRSLAETVHLLQDNPGNARLLAGGTDLLVASRATDDPLAFIDVKGVGDLPPALIITDDRMEIGPTLTMTEVADHETVGAWFPGLVEAAAQVGSRAIRNRATLIGNLCNASPAADTPCPLLVVPEWPEAALVELLGPDGFRQVPLEEFFLGNRQTVCESTELVTRLVLRRPSVGTSSAYLRMTRRKGVDLVTVAVAAAVDAHSRVRLAFAAVGPRPVLSPWSQPIDLGAAAEVTAVVEEAAKQATPITNIRGSAEYRAAMLHVLGRRAIALAVTRRDEGERP